MIITYHQVCCSGSWRTLALSLMTTWTSEFVWLSILCPPVVYLLTSCIAYIVVTSIASCDPYTDTYRCFWLFPLGNWELAPLIKCVAHINYNKIFLPLDVAVGGVIRAGSWDLLTFGRFDWLVWMCPPLLPLAADLCCCRFGCWVLVCKFGCMDWRVAFCSGFVLTLINDLPPVCPGLPHICYVDV